jgi:hypothetical protein
MFVGLRLRSLESLDDMMVRSAAELKDEAVK